MGTLLFCEMDICSQIGKRFETWAEVQLTYFYGWVLPAQVFIYRCLLMVNGCIS